MLMTRLQEITKNLIKDKKVLILGYGREGKSTYSYLKKVGGMKLIAVSDMNKQDLEDADTEIIYGDSYLDCLKEYDIVFKSPGVVIEPKYTVTRQNDGYYIENENADSSTRICSEIELFMQAYGDKTIGITGTKGKSTTSSFIFHLLKTAGKDTVFAGNIGIPVFDIEGSIKDDTVIVVELSCHQLEYCAYAPHRAILLNLYEDHLDHYGSFDKYVLAKSHIYSEENKLFTSAQARDVIAALCRSAELGMKEVPALAVYPDVGVLPFASFGEVNGASLRGSHNLLNLAFAYEAVAGLEISDEDFIKAVGSFETLPHRLEFAGCYQEVDYYDDSISTTVESAISAIESIDNASTVLIGGMDRGIDYSGLVSYLPTCRLDHVVLMYESGKRIYNLIKEAGVSSCRPDFAYCRDLKEAVSFAQMATRKGGACLLSPAAASYGYFKNFEERGDVFKELIKK